MVAVVLVVLGVVLFLKSFERRLFMKMLENMPSPPFIVTIQYLYLCSGLRGEVE